MSISPQSPTIRSRLEEEDYARLVASARENERSVAQEVRLAVKQYLNGKGKS